MGESKGEGGSWLYGLILMIAGGFILINGILNALGITFLAGYLALVDPELAVLATSLGYIYLAIGAWGIIGGIGLIKDQEWGWGISLVVLSSVIVAFLADVVSAIMTMALFATFDLVIIIKLVAIIIAIVGIVYLLLTKEKYA